MHLVRLCAVLSAAAALSGCWTVVRTATAEQRAAAQALATASEKCVYEVRDKKMKYEAAPSCVALKALSGAYIDIGGMRLDAPPETEHMFTVAQKHAWMALALSESQSPEELAIW